VKGGIVSIAFKALKTHSSEYPRMVRSFLSCLHACILASPRAAFQFAKLDAVPFIINFGLYGVSGEINWRSWGILADACVVDETKKLFVPDEDIQRVIEMIDRIGRSGGDNSDIEIVIQALRFVGEIVFNSSFKTSDLWSKMNTVIKPFWSTSVNFPLQAIIYGLLNKRFPQKNQNRFDRFTSPNGRDLTFSLSDNIVKDFNIWVTSGGGSQVGANIARRSDNGDEVGEEPRERSGRKKGGLLDSFAGYF
jgi:hypothetical protein